MLFSALDRGLQAHLLRISRLREFADGQIIQQRGDAADGFWLIDEGAVRVGQFMPDGEFRAVALLGPGCARGSTPCGLLSYCWYRCCQCHGNGRCSAAADTAAADAMASIPARAGCPPAGVRG